jgi:starvation-inducible DNA-binding protein
MRELAAAPHGWCVVVRRDRTVLHDGPAQDVDRVVRESLRLLVLRSFEMGIPLVEVSPAAIGTERAGSARDRWNASCLEPTRSLNPGGTMATTSTPSRNGQRLPEAQPITHQRGRVIQPYGTIASYPLALPDDVRAASAEALNQLLSDTITLRDMYKKHHWQVSGPTFYSLHLLFDKHYEEQTELVDKIAERVQTLGAVAIAMAHDVAETTKIERPPRGREEVPVQLSRLLDAHEQILAGARKLAKDAASRGDDGTNDLVVSDIIRTNEMQVWFVAEHLVDTPLVRAK